jgi:hypothetical protein
MDTLHPFYAHDGGIYQGGKQIGSWEAGVTRETYCNDTSYLAGLNFDGDGGIYQGGKQIGAWRKPDEPQNIHYPNCTCGPWGSILPPPPCPLHSQQWFTPPVNPVVYPPVVTTTGTATPAVPTRIPDYVPED